MSDGREPSRRIYAVSQALENMFDSDAYDATWGLTPVAYKNLSDIFQRFGYKLERVKNIGIR